MTIGVLAATQDRARNIIHTDSFLRGKFGDDLLALSPRSNAHRGHDLEAIFVSSDLWPLDKELASELAPCLYAHGGSFYIRLP